MVLQGVQRCLLPFQRDRSIESIDRLQTRNPLCSILCFPVKLCGTVVVNVWNRLLPLFVGLFRSFHLVFDDDSSPSSFSVVCALSYSDLSYLSRLMEMWPK